MMIIILIHLFQTIDQSQLRHECKDTELQETERRAMARQKIKGEKRISITGLDRKGHVTVGCSCDLQGFTIAILR
jgi:hypothetical protein